MARDLAIADTLPVDPAPPLGTAQMRAIVALASGSTMTEAAEQAGVDRRTLHNWRRTDPEFIAELNRVRVEARDKVRAELRGLATEAVATIRAVMTDGRTPADVQLKAAWKVLESVGALEAEAIGPTEPEAVRRNLERAAQFERMCSLALPPAPVLAPPPTTRRPAGAG